jgi:hypothetical protein
MVFTHRSIRGFFCAARPIRLWAPAADLPLWLIDGTRKSTAAAQSQLLHDNAASIYRL